jgi:hypothetical protein
VRAGLADAVSQAWDDTLCWFGPADGGALRPLVEARVVAEAGEALRARFLADAAPLLAAAGISGMLRRVEPGWEPAQALPWTRWDECVRRVR